MKRNNCEIVRREIDELMLEERGTAAAVAHLQECYECREFQEKQTNLRRMVGSLGTVAAPADFDFRLRARLANESKGAFQFSALSRLFARRGLAVAAALLLFLATGVVVVRNLLNQERVEVVKTNNPAANPGQQTSPVPASEPREEGAIQREAVVTSHAPKVPPGRSAPVGHPPRKNVVAEDFSKQRAEIYGGTKGISNSEVFPIDASLDSFKVSLDDGRGNARTISLPAIRFGSQRILPGDARYAATKRVW
jgi:hypothetical protein